MGQVMLIVILLLLTLTAGLAQVPYCDPDSAAASQIPYACDESNAALSGFPFCNKSLPTSERVQDYISRLTLREKICHLRDTSLFAAGGVTRLGVPSYQWWQEALHGVSSTPGTTFNGTIRAATSFPLPILTAASFNTSLFLAIGQAVSTEARALHNAGQSGITFWSPNINIFRDPRWGRGQETPGEDPLLASLFATNYVKGLQDTDSGGDALKVSACCKHLTAYDLESWNGADRYHFNALVTKQDLADSYNTPFKSCVEDGGASCVMCAYNRLNGVPTCADHDLLTETVRNTWKLNGYIVTDCDSLQVLFNASDYAPTPEDAVADGLLAGLNLNCGNYLAWYLPRAMEQQKVTEPTVDQALAYLVAVQMRLGLFNGDPAAQPYGSLGPDDVCSTQNQELAVDAARQGIVLLKNEGNTLPFSSSKIKTLAVLGPHGNSTRTMIGNYEGVPCKYTSPLQGLEKYAQVSYAPGCEDTPCNSTSLFSSAVARAAEADAVVLFVGLDLHQEVETRDRTSLLLPGHQQELVSQVVQSAKGPVVLVILSGGPVDVSFAKNDSRISSILWAGFPGEAGGAAIAEVIFGYYNPGGKLAVTWYPESFTKVSMVNMTMRPDPSTGYPGRTHRFYTGPTIFQFGHGLSYTNLSHSFYAAATTLSIPTNAVIQTSSNPDGTSSLYLDAEDQVSCAALKTNVKISVQNRGAMSASHPVLLFSIPPNAGQWGNPKKQLAGFSRIHIAADSTSVASLDIDPCKHLSHADANGKRLLHAGIHTLTVEEVAHSLQILMATIEERASRGEVWAK